jgi:hypothetical protein
MIHWSCFGRSPTSQHRSALRPTDWKANFGPLARSFLITGLATEVIIR